MIKRYLFLIPLGLSFYILDFFLRLYNIDINFGSIISIAPSFFTLSWVTLFSAIIILLGKKRGKLFYVSVILFFALMLFVNYFHLNIFGTFFSFKNIVLSGEVMNYFKEILKYINWPIILTYILCLILIVITLKLLPKDKIKSDIIIGIILIIISLISFNIGRYFLGNPVDKLEWNAWNQKRNIYNDYTETRKSVQVSGLYEYVFRDIKLSAFNKREVNLDEIKYLDNYFKDDKLIKKVSLETNNDKYKGIYKDKNLIFVLMESIDEWLVDKETMPTLYTMMNEGINFTNHFSPVFGGGATFNSEFMINTGYMTPLNGGSAAYSYGNNAFPYSLPNLFIKDNYKHVNEFHMNYGSFYNRGQMAKAFGYNNYYSSFDMKYEQNIQLKILIL